MIIITRVLLLVVLISAPGLLHGQSVSTEDYKRAEKFLTRNISARIFGGSVSPNWIGETDRFWYVRNVRDGKRFVLVDPSTGQSRPAFDHERLSAALSRASGKEISAKDFPFDRIEFSDDESTISFDVAGDRWSCGLTEYNCEKSDSKTTPGNPFHSTSPDGKWVASLKEGNLFVQPPDKDSEPVALTDDAQGDFDYAIGPDFSTFGPRRKAGGLIPPDILWSNDSTRILTYRLDERNVKENFLLQYSAKLGSRARLHRYRYAMPGDEHLPVAHPVIFHIETKQRIDLQVPPNYCSAFSPITAQDLKWSKDGTKVFWFHHSRDATQLTAYEINAATGQAREIFSEKSKTPVLPSVFGNVFYAFPDGQRFLWGSQRDGRHHLYLYKGNSCSQLTSGEWNVANVVRVDEESGKIFFYGTGREDGRDPYYPHLYSTELNGGEPQLLTPDDASHAVTFSPSGKFFLDTFSRVDLPPVTRLYRSDGSRVAEIDKANIDDLLATGWKLPERFSVKARDGKTDLHGILYKPSQFDPSKKYPLIDNNYGGVQTPIVPKTFAGTRSRLFSYGEPNALAELGFVVMMLDGMGTPGRSREFHEVSYRNIGDAAGLKDHVTGIQQLAERYEWIDLNRVGIYGHSGGGYGSARAMLLFPDFFKVGVSSAGNHDQRVYISGWGERYHQLLDGDNYVDQANSTHAEMLKGKLLLAYGDLDENVHPAGVVQLIDALIKANKDFDLLMLPNRDHGFSIEDYFVRKTWDYFVEHLLLADPPQGYEIGSQK